MAVDFAAAKLPGLFRTKVDVLADVERRVLAGEFAVGSRLPSERTLCAEYSVSRPVIREVLSGLLERGYIEIYPGRGSFIRAVATHDLARQLVRVAQRAGVTARDLVAARLVLESAAAELAAELADDADGNELRAALAAHASAATVRELADTDLAFHETVARASGNPVIAIMFGSIRTYVYGLMLRSHSDQDVRQAGEPWHEVIADRISAHDPAGARDAMAEHVRLALDLYGEDLDIPLTDVLKQRGFDPTALSAAGSLAPNAAADHATAVDARGSAAAP